MTVHTLGLVLRVLVTAANEEKAHGVSAVDQQTLSCCPKHQRRLSTYLAMRDFQEINYPNKRTTETQRTQREEK